MIRFLQQDNKLIKIMFGVIIGAAVISMVVYLVPGLMDNSTANDTTIYATVHTPGLMGRIFGESTPIKMDDVNRLAQQQLQQQHLPEFMLPYVVSQAGNHLVQMTILQQEADKLNLQVSDADLRDFLKATYGERFFPNGQFIGMDAYASMLSTFGISIKDFEDSIKQEMELRRLEALVTGGVTVSDAAVRDAYRVQGTKVKFDYAVVASDDLKKSINPTDADLQGYFQQNVARYSKAIPETRRIEYIAFDASKLPGGKQAVSDAEIQSYYTSHAAEYKTEEQVQTRHILINSKTGTDAQTDAAAKAKAQDVLKQLQSGGNFADLAKKYSDDPGSKDKGGELPLIPTASLDPAYAKAAMALNPGQTSGLVKSSFGYHIIQTEQKIAAGVKPLADVKASIDQILEQQKQGAQEQQFAQQLAADAAKNGMEKSAAAHGLKAVTTDFVAHDGTIGGLSDSTALLAQAFATAKGAAPVVASTGDGYAVFQVIDAQSAHAPDFTSYKPHILDDYRQQKLPQLLTEATQKLADRAKALGDLKKAAAEMKVPIKSSDFVGQEGQVTDLGSMSGPGKVAFSLPKGGISGAIDAGQNGVVLAVTDKQEPSADDMAKNIDATREQLLSAQKQQIFEVFAGTLTQKYQNAGGVRLSQQPATPPAGLPSGS